MKIGIDLGGSHIGVGIVNEGCKLVLKKEMDLQIEENSDQIKKYLEDSIILLINESLREVGAPMCVIESIGVAVPGQVEDGIVKKLHNLKINQIDIKKLLGDYYGVEVNIKNDAKCACLAEKKFGALEKYDDAVFMCLGTGIGGATIYDGKLVEPIKAAGSEFGHMIIKKDGTECNCGNKGCFEKYASMRTFKENVIKILNLNENINSKELLDIVLKESNNNSFLSEYIDEFIDDLLVGISNIVNIIEPQAICIGGGFVYYEKVLYTRLMEKITNNKYKFNVPEIVLAKLGNDAGIIGACLI